MCLTRVFSIALLATLVSVLGMSSAHAVTIVIDEVNNVRPLPPGGMVTGSVILCEGGLVPCGPPAAPGDQDQPGFWSDVLTFTISTAGGVNLATLASDFCGETVCPPADLLQLQAPPPSVFVPEVIFTFGGLLWDGAMYTPGPMDPGFLFLPGGDVATYAILSDQIVPLPAAVWMFGSALGVLGWVKRKAIA